MSNEIKEILKIEVDCDYKKLSVDEIITLKDYITNLQQKVDQYENPDDLTLFYMWLDEKAKDKMKHLQQENQKLLKICGDYDKQINRLKEDYIALQNASEQYEDKLEARIDELSRLIIATQDSELIYRLNEIIGDNK